MPSFMSGGGGAAAPIVVQGTVVNSNHGIPAQTHNHGPGPRPGGPPDIAQGTGEWTKGQPQPKRCNDAFFALLFYAHLAVLGFCSFTFAPQMFDNMYDGYAQRRFLRRELGEGDEEANNNNNGEVQIKMDSLLIILAFSGLVGFFVSSMALGFMMTFAEALIKFALWFNILTSGLLAVMTLLSGAIPLAIMFIIMFALTCYFTYRVWSRIPFAACNMKTAITAVRANFGLSFFAYLSLALTFAFSMLWGVTMVSTNFVTNGCSAEGECERDPNGIVIFLFLISYYWTLQVINNVTHVTVAGTVGTWWFSPREASSCCSPAVKDSWFRAMTFSFGSICFGSLIVAIIQAVKEMVHQMRQQDDGILICLAECILGCIESLVEYFNQWAFVYVGLYGYTFMEAGKNVMTLFRSRGWTAIIIDHLTDSVLNMISLLVGFLTGLIAMGVAWGGGLDIGDGTLVGPFVIGFLFGFVLAATLFSIVSSAINTVIVCYAEAPNEFQSNHPQLSEEMRAAWRQAWPNDFRY